MAVRFPLLLSVFLVLLALCQGFVPVSKITRRRCAHFAANSESHDVWLLRWDGAVADADSVVDWRIQVGMKAAESVWPEQVSIPEDREWLVNKLRASSHVLEDTCQYAYLVRMLLEEQELDRGRSVNCKGKYGSKYHPQKEEDQKYSSSAPSSTRPLTVGEIAENWNNMLFDTVRMKYRVASSKSKFGVDSMPKLRDFTLSYKEPFSIPILSSMAAMLTSDQRHPTILFVRDASDVHVAEQSLKASEIPFQTTSNAQEAVLSAASGRTVLLSSSWDDVLRACPDGSTLRVVDSSYRTLETRGVPLFGDNIPRGGVGKSRTPDRRLSLYMIAGGHPSESAKAIMSAWMEEISREELKERIQTTSSWE